MTEPRRLPTPMQQAFLLAASVRAAHAFDETVRQVERTMSKPIPGLGLVMLGPNWYTKLGEQWQRYLAEAHALGITERDARLVVASIQHLAQQLPYAVDVLAEARAILREGIVEQVERP